MPNGATFALLFAIAVTSGCEKKEPASETVQRTDAGVPKAEALDPDIAQAVAAASAARAKNSGPQQGGPPANGIFAPGAADHEMARGAPPKLTLGSEGADPKVNFMPAQPKPGTKQNGTITIAQSQGGIPVEFGVAFEAQKAKTDGAPIPVVVRVTSARVAVAGAPPDVESKVAGLRGAKVEYEVLPDGAGTGYHFELPKSVPPELGDSVRSLSDVLAVITLPYPQKPVGVGGFWMATSRDGVLGLDLVTYRMIKVEKVEGSKVTLTVNTKRYSTSSNFDLPGLPPDAPRTMTEFQSVAEGTVEIQPGKGFPIGGEQNSVLSATLQDPTKPAARGTLEVRTRADLRSGS